MSHLKELPKPVDDKKGWPWTEEVDPIIYDKNINWPKISIVTPCFNQGHFIEETIRSILLQNYPNLEYIVIDGGSTDNTVEILKDYDQWITYWVSEPDNGQSDAINKGIVKSTGEIFNWLNSDDFLEVEALLKIGSCFNQNQYLNVVVGDIRVFNDLGYEKFDNYKVKYSSFQETILNSKSVKQSATFYRKPIIDDLGLLPSEFHHMMDFYWWIKYLLKYTDKAVKEIDFVLVNFRLHSSSKTFNDSYKFNFDFLKIASYINFYFKSQLITELTNNFNIQEKNYEGLFQKVLIEKDVFERWVLQNAVLRFSRIEGEKDFQNAKKLKKFLLRNGPSNFELKIPPVYKYLDLLPSFMSFRIYQQIIQWKIKMKG